MFNEQTNNISNETEHSPVPDAVPEPKPPEVPDSEPTEQLFNTDEKHEGMDDTVYEPDMVAEIDEYTPEQRSEMEARYDETMKVFRSGELVEGKIVSISESDVSVDIGFKSEGSIDFEEFDEPKKLKVGDVIEVCIEKVEDKSGTLVLSKRKAEFTRTWEKINQLYQTGEMVETMIARRIKGGMVVDLYGIEAFLPGSQIDVHPVRDFDALVGMMMDFRVIKVNNARKNVVLSHKVLIEESLREIREKVLSELETGQIVEGTVKNITDFGVFVDLGGVDGLLHITDLSWGRIGHPSEVVELDQQIKVKILQYDQEKQRISLGLKQLHEPNWDEIESKFPIAGKTKGKVVSIVKYGAFVELEPGVEGLVHISEMSWTQHIKHPSQLISVGDEIDIVILSIDRDGKKISLGMKQVEEDPWKRLEKVYVPGSRHKGRVRDLVPFGAFIELEQGIDGLIHISDLSWTRKVRHPGEIIKKNQEIEIVILGFDRNERRIALGLKQLEDDPWHKFEKEYSIRSRTEGSVIRVLEKGIVIMLPLGVEGFVPNSRLGRSLAAENKKKIKEGDNLELEVIEFDKTNHRIVLSHAIIEREKDKTTYRTYKDTGDDSRTTLGDIIQRSGLVVDTSKPIKEPREKQAGKSEDEKANKKPSKPAESIKTEPPEQKEPIETTTEVIETEVKAEKPPKKKVKPAKSVPKAEAKEEPAKADETTSPESIVVSEKPTEESLEMDSTDQVKVEPEQKDKPDKPPVKSKRKSTSKSAYKPGAEEAAPPIEGPTQPEVSDTEQEKDKKDAEVKSESKPPATDSDQPPDEDESSGVEKDAALAVEEKTQPAELESDKKDENAAEVKSESIPPATDSDQPADVSEAATPGSEEQTQPKEASEGQETK